MLTCVLLGKREEWQIKLREEWQIKLFSVVILCYPPLSHVNGIMNSMAHGAFLQSVVESPFVQEVSYPAQLCQISIKYVMKPRESNHDSWILGTSQWNYNGTLCSEIDTMCSGHLELQEMVNLTASFCIILYVQLILCDFRQYNAGERKQMACQMLPKLLTTW